MLFDVAEESVFVDAGSGEEIVGAEELEAVGELAAGFEEGFVGVGGKVDFE